MSDVDLVQICARVSPPYFPITLDEFSCPPSGASFHRLGNQELQAYR